jgi:hypothetical protein
MEDEESFDNQETNEATGDDDEGFAADGEEEEGFAGSEEEEEGFTNPKSTIVDGDKVAAEFAPDYMLPRTMRNQSVEVPLYQIAEQTEKGRIVDIDGIDESVQHAGTELADAYKTM